VVAVLRSGWLTTGPEAKALEQEFSALMGGRGALAISSATAGFDMAFSRLAVEGTEIVFPAYTFSSPVMAALHAGASGRSSRPSASWPTWCIRA
jgi:dTDP-4-amino-4,6-dideoxygalactose transaminase